MSFALLSANGRLTVPKAVRESQGWAPGTRLEIRETPQGLLLTQTGKTKRDLQAGLKTLHRLSDDHRPRRSLADVDAAIAAEVPRRDGR